MASANIINLEDLVPGIEGKTFRVPSGVDEKGEKTYASYHVPGDLDSETVFEFLRLFEDMTEFQTKRVQLEQAAGDDPEKTAKAVSETMDAMKQLNDKVKEKLLAVFQVANPELTALPFGAATTMVVLGEILEMMGLAAPADLPEPPDPPRPTRKPRDRQPKASAARK